MGRQSIWVEILLEDSGKDDKDMDKRHRGFLDVWVYADATADAESPLTAETATTAVPPELILKLVDPPVTLHQTNTDKEGLHSHGHDIVIGHPGLQKLALSVKKNGKLRRSLPHWKFTY